MKVTHEKLGSFLFQHVALESIMGQWEEYRGQNTGCSAANAQQHWHTSLAGSCGL